LKQLIVDRLDKLFAGEPFMKAGGVEDTQVDAAQAALGVAFTDECQQFLRQYAGGLIGS